MNDEKILYQAHPSTWRNRPVVFLLCVASIALFGLGVILLLVWFLRAAAQTLTVTDERVIYRRGLIAKHTSEVMRDDVRNVMVSQTIGQRIFGVGSIAVSSAGTGGSEIAIAGIPAPYKAQQAIKSKNV